MIPERFAGHTSDVLAGRKPRVFSTGADGTTSSKADPDRNLIGGAGKNEFRIEAKLTDPSMPLVVPGEFDCQSARPIIPSLSIAMACKTLR